MNDQTTKPSAVAPYEPSHPGESFFSSTAAFNHGLRMATMLSKSDLVPKNYKDNPANCMIALGLAQRMGSDPLIIMQNMHPINGRPSFGSAFLIATLNTCGRFESLQYEVNDLGKKEVTDPNGKKVVIQNVEVIAFAKDKRTGENLRGTPVSSEMAVLEGWWTKDRSKWPSMWQQMLRYRAAAFFVRIFAPELSMGMKTVEENEDFIEYEDVTPVKKSKSNAAAALTVVDEKETEEYAESKGEETPADEPAEDQDQATNNEDQDDDDLI